MSMNPKEEVECKLCKFEGPHVILTPCKEHHECPVDLLLNEEIKLPDTGKRRSAKSAKIKQR